MEIISPHDPRICLFDEGKRREINGFISRGFFGLVSYAEGGEDPNIVPPRFFLALALAIFCFDMYSMDFIQAYLQSASQLRRKLFIKPDIINLGANELLQQMKYIYGLPDSGDFWHESFRDHNNRA